MKKSTLMITIAASLCALTSCGRSVTTYQASQPDEIKAVSYEITSSEKTADKTSEKVTTAKKSDTEKSTETFKTESAVTAAAVKVNSVDTTSVRVAVTTAAKKPQPAKTTVKTTAKTVAATSKTTAKQTQTTVKTTAKPQTTTTTTTAVGTIESGRLDAAAAEGTAFRKGVSNGNVYTSEYAGFKFTAPADTSFLNEDDLYTYYYMPARVMTDEEKKIYFTGISDAVGTYANAEGRVEVKFINTKLRYPDTPNMSEESFLNDYLESGLAGTVYTYVSGPEIVTLGGKDYYMMRTESNGYLKNVYVRRVDENFMVEILASGSAVADENDFAGRFEAV